MTDVPAVVPPVAPKPDLIQSIGNFFGGIFGSQTFNSVWHAALSGATTYLVAHVNGATGISATGTGIGVAALGGVVGWLQGAETPAVSK